MKVLPFKIPKPESAALVYQVDLEHVFYDKLHQHEEIQLSYIVKGEGNLIVGDTINYYKSGDIIVIGSQLPHVFESDREHQKQSHMQTLFFTKNSFGKDFFNLEELTELHAFFKRAKHGFKITSKQTEFVSLFNSIEKATKLERFIILLQLLKLFSRAEHKSLSSFIYEKNFSIIEGERMRNVFDYTMTNYEKDITLETVANVANMTKMLFVSISKNIQIKLMALF